MYPSIIKYYCIFLFSIYILIKLLNKSIRSTKSNILIILFALILTLVTRIPFIQNTNCQYLVPLLFLWIITSLFTSHPQISFVATSISFGISYGIQAVSSFASTVIIYSLTNIIDYYTFLKISIVSAILHTLISLSLLRVKRLKIGLPLLTSSTYLNTATVICLVFTFLPTYTAYTSEPLKIKVITLIAPIIFLAFLIFWWQAQITKSYRHRLLMRELESRRTSEAEKDALIQKLYAEIDRLARISHRDNSLIMAIKDAAIKGLRTDFESTEELVATREKLIANIEKLSEDRSSIPSDYHEKKIHEFKTGLGLLDDLLQLMGKNAIEHGITFSVHFGIPIKYFVPSTLSESDLVHTVDDLLKNAFKSTRTCEKRIVQLQFYKLGKHLVVDVSDNGIPFEVRSLVNMGIEKRTTYEDGSGIGLMDIWSTKEKYRATYHLDEYATATPFSKKISLTFDKKNRYSIRTWRKDEILKMSRRADLQVYDHVD